MLVHCQAGVHRAPVLMGVLLPWLRRITFDEVTVAGRVDGLRISRTQKQHPPHVHMFRFHAISFESETSSPFGLPQGSHSNGCGPLAPLTNTEATQREQRPLPQNPQRETRHFRYAFADQKRLGFQFFQRPIIPHPLIGPPIIFPSTHRPSR